mgnify:CR=1 FL=1
MKTYLTDLIPKIQRFSKKLDDLTTLTNQHWVVVDELINSKSIYIFRSNSELLISLNGKVEKAKWEYIGNNSLLIDKKDKSYLFKHGFLDENILALKVDSKEEYAFLVNENKYEGELNSFSNIIEFLSKNYLNKRKFNPLAKKIVPTYEINEMPKQKESKMSTLRLKTSKGELLIIGNYKGGPLNVGDKVLLNNKPAPNGKYRYNYVFSLTVKNGKIRKI